MTKREKETLATLEWLKSQNRGKDLYFDPKTEMWTQLNKNAVGGSNEKVHS